PDVAVRARRSARRIGETPGDSTSRRPPGVRISFRAVRRLVLVLLVMADVVVQRPAVARHPVLEEDERLEREVQQPSMEGRVVMVIVTDGDREALERQQGERTGD